MDHIKRSMVQDGALWNGPVCPTHGPYVNECALCWKNIVFGRHPATDYEHQMFRNDRESNHAIREKLG